MAAKIYYQEDCNLSLLEGKTIAIIGYGISGIFVWIPCDVDRGNNGMDKKSRTCDDVLSDVLASGNATDDFVCMERKMDGSVRPAKSVCSKIRTFALKVIGIK